MAKLVSAWADDDRLYMVQRLGSDVAIRTARAVWAMFVSGLDDSDRASIARDRRITSLSVEPSGLTRIECRNRWARRDVAELIEVAAERAESDVKVLEADVSPVRRVMSDVGSLEVDGDPRLLYLDLETDSRKSFDDARTGRARVLSWAASSGSEEWSAVLEADTDAAERDLFASLFAVLDHFDCVIAWYGSSFDFEVLRERAATIRFQRSGREVLWHRWTWLDHLEVFKKYNMHSDGGGEQKSSFKLDHVATYLLGEGKQDFDANQTWQAWVAGGEERARLLRYNVQDTALLPRIEAKTGFIALHLAVCEVCRVFPDTESLNATSQGDGFLLRLGTERGYRWPTRKFGEDPNLKPFRGAFVMEPTRLGAVDNVHVCDFAGLYPSIIRTWNMSPDTKIDGARRNALAFRSERRFMADDEDQALVPGLDPAVDSATCQLPARATWFATDRDGMFRVALDSLVAKRAEYTNEMKRHPAGSAEHERSKRLSGAFKIVANSFYGILGSPWSRFFDVEIAEGVTQTGRWLLERVIEEAKASGLDPFYGDTDSAFVAGDAAAMRDVVERMNARWRQLVEPWGITSQMPCHIDLDFEKTFHRLIVVSAKRYAGRYATYKGKPALPDAKPEVKGLEFKRGDAIRLAREFQTEVVMELLGYPDPPGKPLSRSADLRAIVDRWRARILTGDLALEEVTLSQSLSKPLLEYARRYTSASCKGCHYDFGGVEVSRDAPEKCPSCTRDRKKVLPPAHVRVATLLKERGVPLGEGARVAYVFVRGPSGKTEVVPASDSDVMARVDRIYYWENRIYPATERILERVYPAEVWAESRAEKKQRVKEAAGQLRIDFATSSEGSMTTQGPRIRRRRVEPVPEIFTGRVRRRRVQPSVTVEIHEATNIPDGGAEAFRRRALLEAIQAAILAHPGDTPVEIVVKWNDVVSGTGVHVKVTMPTNLKIEKTEEARRALVRVAGRPELVSGFAT